MLRLEIVYSLKGEYDIFFATVSGQRISMQIQFNIHTRFGDRVLETLYHEQLLNNEKELNSMSHAIINFRNAKPDSGISGQAVNRAENKRTPTIPTTINNSIYWTGHFLTNGDFLNSLLKNQDIFLKKHFLLEACQR